MGDIGGDFSDQGHLLHAQNDFLLLLQAAVGFGDPGQLLLQPLIEGRPLDGEGEGKGEGLQRLQVFGGDRPAVDQVVRQQQADAPVLADQGDENHLPHAQRFDLLRIDVRLPVEILHVPRLLLVEGANEEVIGAAQRHRELLQQIAEFGAFRGNLLFVEDLRQFAQGVVVFFDFLPDAGRLLAPPGTDGEIAAQILPFFIHQEQKGPIQTESLAGGDGGKGHGDDLVDVDRGLQDEGEFVQELDLPVAVVDLAGEGLHLHPQRKELLDHIGEEPAEPFGHRPQILHQPRAFEAALEKTLLEIEQKVLLVLPQERAVVGSDVFLLPAAERFHQYAPIGKKAAGGGVRENRGGLELSVKSGPLAQ